MSPGPGTSPTYFGHLKITGGTEWRPTALATAHHRWKETLPPHQAGAAALTRPSPGVFGTVRQGGLTVRQATHESGLGPRAVPWSQSARHWSLLARLWKRGGLGSLLENHWHERDSWENLLSPPQNTFCRDFMEAKKTKQILGNKSKTPFSEGCDVFHILGLPETSWRVEGMGHIPVSFSVAHLLFVFLKASISAPGSRSYSWGMFLVSSCMLLC